MTSVKLYKGSDLPARDRQHERVVRMTQVIESFASGFTLRPISVKLVTEGQAPAFSSSNRIWFNESTIGDLQTAVGVASLKGLTLHEIAHILLTPRTGSDLAQWVRENKVHRAWNSLEDQRIESLLLASFPSIRDWLVATMEEYLLKTPQQWSLAFPLIRGRKYLDAKVRRMVKDLYVRQEDVAELSDIIDQYRLLDLTKDEDVETSKALVLRYSELTKDLSLPNPHGHEHRSDDEHETNAKSKPWSKKKQSEASDKVKDEEYEDEDDLDSDDLYDNVQPYDDEDDEPEDDSDESADGEGDNPEQSEDDDASADGGEPMDADGDAETPADSTDEGQGDKPDTNTSEAEGETASDTTGGAGAGGDHIAEALADLLKGNLSDTLDRLGDRLANDIGLYNGDVLLEGEDVPAPKHFQNETVRTVGTEAVKASEDFAFELQQLRTEHAPAWHQRVADGRINPVRWETGCDIEEAFDRYEDGRDDATDIECVIVLDVSGSMGGEIVEAHESMWAIKNALDSVQARTTVVAFSDGYHSAYTLYEGEEQVDSTMRFIGSMGGTDPLKALQYGHSVLAKSNRAIRMLITITDGMWNSDTNESCEELIRTLRDGGVMTALAWLSRRNTSPENIDSHGSEIVSHVRDAKDLFHLGRALVEVGIQRQLTH